MRLSRSLTLGLAALTLAPWAYLLLAEYLIPRLHYARAAGPLGSFYATSTPGFPLQIAALLLNVLVLLAFYLFFLFRTDRVPKSQRMWWVVALVLGSLVTMPIFWYRYLWRGTAGAA